MYIPLLMSRDGLPCAHSLERAKLLDSEAIHYNPPYFNTKVVHARVDY